MFWNWLRNRVRESVLAGVADAVREIEAADGAAPPWLAQLPAAVAVPLIEAADAPPRKGRRTAAE